jgi:hypothetical protein
MSSDFDQAVKDLVDISKKILEFGVVSQAFATKREKKKTVKNPALKCLKNYYADYNLNDEEGNKEDILITYRKIKAALLKGHKVDAWLKGSSIAIYSGAIEPDDERKLMLSEIYSLACRHRDQSKESLKGLPVEAYDMHEELLFAAKFQLYMYRTFLFALSGEEYGDDITKLAAIVAELEKDLKITPKKLEIIPGVSVPTDSNNLVEGFAGLAKDLIGKLGVQVPEGAQIPTAGIDIMGMASSLFNRPETKDFLMGMTESLKGAKDPGDALQKVLGKFQDPSSMEQLKKLATGLIPPEPPKSS